MIKVKTFLRPCVLPCLIWSIASTGRADPKPGPLASVEGITQYELDNGLDTHATIRHALGHQGKELFVIHGSKKSFKSASTNHA